MIKIIYIYWNQGFEYAPIIVKKCVYSWFYYNSPSWNIILLDKNNINQYIDFSFEKYNYVSLIHQSDIIRLLLLQKYGGLWVDSTCFCNRPLDIWFNEYMQNFFVFDKPYKNFLISNWFIYSSKNNYIINNLLKNLLKYYEYPINNQKQDYFIFHKIFKKLHKDNKKFNNLFELKKKYCANCYKGPHYIHLSDFFKSLKIKHKKNYKKNIDEKISPLYKLSYKCDFDKNYCKDTVLYYLFSSINVQ
jgi:hypothetical protein